MNKHLFACFALLAGLALSSTVLAAPSPSDTVRKIIAELKSTKDMAVVLEHVHWPTAYKNNPSLGPTKASSPEELKDQYKKVLTDPAAVMRQQMAASGRSEMPEAQLKMVMQRLEQQITQMKAEMGEKIGRTEYQISGEEISGDRAVVTVTSELDGKSDTSDVDLILIDGKWYLSSFEGVGKATDKGR